MADRVPMIRLARCGCDGGLAGPAEIVGRQRPLAGLVEAAVAHRFLEALAEFLH